MKKERDEWIELYILLTLRMDKLFQAHDSSSFIETYYGPKIYQTQIRDEPQIGFRELIKQSEDLLESLSDQGYDRTRTEYLRKMILSIGTMARLKAGEELPFFQLIRQILDIEPIWIPESEFEEALRLIDQALPGNGDVRTRYQTWQNSMLFQADQPDEILPVVKFMLAEARKRTEALIGTMDDELDIQIIRGVNYGAANWYLGNYKSRMELNLDRPVYLFALLYQMCHEAYPGHHTEACLKEKYLYRGRGYQEQSVFFTLGPQLTISEGIASLAMEMIFSSHEAAEWITEYLSHFFKPEFKDADLELLLRAFSIISPDDLGSNLAQLIEAGRKRDEVIAYAMEYSPYSEEQLRSYLQWVDSPLARIYSFTYSHGKRILRPLVFGKNKKEMIFRLLTEQLVPSMLSSQDGAV